MTTILQILAAIPSLVKTIIELMTIAEQAFGQGKGAEKKQSVMDSVQSMVGNSELWEKVKNLFSSIINTVALFNFGSSGKEPIK